MTNLVSIVIPTHNEARNIPELYSRLSAVARLSESLFEFIFVDDSTDQTPNLIMELRKADSRIRLLRLTRSFGQTAAIQAGLDIAVGQAVVMMDADLQDPPEAITLFMEKWELGYKVVYATRPSQGTWAYRVASVIFYELLARLSSTNIPRNAGEFRLLDRVVVDLVNSMPDKTRFMRGLTIWSGHQSIGVEIVRSERSKGSSSYNFRRSLSVAIDGLVGHSLAPLRLVSLVGIAMVSSALLAAGSLLVASFLGYTGLGAPWAPILLAVTFIVGVNVCLMGIIAEYLGKIFRSIQDRPHYVVLEDSDPKYQRGE